jgi:thiol-disulfide isomerase/thioredoxin
LKLDLHKSLNWLLRTAPGIEPPPEVRGLGFTTRNGWNHAWTASMEGLTFLETLHTYFVVLDKDGHFAIKGVPAGDYDLALRLYEPPVGGCLVNPVGARVVRFQVSEPAALSPVLNLGEILVKVALGPRPGEMVPDFAFTTGTGKTTRLSALRGNYLLIDFWATWCAPCVGSLPDLAKLQDAFGKDGRLTVLGVNIDDEPDRARALLDRNKFTWTQAFLRRGPDKDENLSRYAISSVPAYFLIGPDGKLIERSENLQTLSKKLHDVLQ